MNIITILSLKKWGCDIKHTFVLHGTPSWHHKKFYHWGVRLNWRNNWSRPSSPTHSLKNKKKKNVLAIKWNSSCMLSKDKTMFQCVNLVIGLHVTYSLHRHSRARPFCCVFDTLSPLRTLLLFFQFHAFSDVCKQTGGSIYMILPVCYYSSDQSHSKNMRIIKTHLDKHW